MGIGLKGFLAILLISTTFLPTYTAANVEQGEYFISSKHMQQLNLVMNQYQIEVIEEFETLNIIRASLTTDELHLLKQAIPDLVVEQNQTYRTASDTVLPSLAKLNVSPSSTMPFTGKNVKVGVLDTGIDTEHRDLHVKGGICSIAPDCTTGIPYDDNNGHGTHVAGVIAALSNHTGVQGIAPQVDLYSIKVLNDLGVGTTNSIIQGIEWAIAQKIDILNISITTTTDDQIMKIALDKAYNQGILLVGAAGNRGVKSSDTVTFPAKYESVIAVSAVNPDLTKLIESSVGPKVEVAAPGGAIFSTYPIEWDFIDGKQDGYTEMSGTSMSAPHVTGVLALYKERFPTMTNDELRTLLRYLAKDLGESGRDDIFGYGLVQYEKVIPGAPTFATKKETGKVTLDLQSSRTDVTVENNGKRVRLVDGVYPIYHTKGTYPVTITYLSEDKQVIKERQFVTIDNPSFTDIKSTQWFNEHIGYLSNKKQINGFDDGSFKPYNEITRGEAAALIGRALGYDEAKTATSFKDVSAQSFASGYIQEAVKQNIITGYKDGTFRPEKKVTRAEMAILISKAFKLEHQQNAKSSFTDISTQMAAYPYILSIIESGITKGYTDHTFRPYEYMTRSEFAAFLSRVQTDQVQ
ncbi:S8 family peptidase [Paenisporosarcina indica]|uniref:S8 family peptidase n=1 Tax=Paenisporosarcina indica TaxID=650093 RepID=UPI00094FF3AD|nr:S8 family serine peptidase [Paenisporosarcina indica]